MKKHSPSPSRAGFTLVELLVVIAIIGLLASVAFPALFSALRQAKATKCAALANQLQTAVVSYQGEYSIYPNPTPATPAADSYYDYTDSTGEWAALMVGLCGDVNPIHPGTVLTQTPDLNTRHIAFMTPTSADLDSKTGILKQPFLSKTGASQYFFLAIDSDYSGSLGDASSAVNGKMPNFNSTKWTTANPTTIDLSGQTSQGVAIWANNDQLVTGGKSNPNFWTHTY